MGRFPSEDHPPPAPGLLVWDKEISTQTHGGAMVHLPEGKTNRLQVSRGPGKSSHTTREQNCQRDLPFQEDQDAKEMVWHLHKFISKEEEGGEREGSWQHEKRNKIETLIKTNWKKE